MIFRYTRFEKTYSSREEAIKKLNNTSRYYAENIAIKYKNGDSFDIILALFRSTTKGDYSINFDSGSPAGSGTATGRTYDVIKRSPEETDQECINRVYFDKDPEERDLVVIYNSKGDPSTYLYHGGLWISLTHNLVLNPINTSTLKLSIDKDEETGDYTVYGEVPIDGSSLAVDPVTKKLSVRVIDGGTLADLR